MKLIKQYFWLILGGILFGLSAAQVKSARRAERKANEKIRDLQDEKIDEFDDNIEQHVQAIRKAEAKAVQRQQNAIKRLDKISANSNSVGDLLNEYNSKRV